MYVVAYSADGATDVMGKIELASGEKESAVLDNIISGNVPSTGYLNIYGDGSFLVSKFTGNNSATGFI